MSTDIKIKKSSFIEKWMSEMTKTMQQANPDWDENEIRETLLDMVEKDIQNPPVNLDNNYTQENRDSTLLSVFDWIDDRKPIISGNGTFYKNQHEAINPIATMLDDKLSMRKKYKKIMFNVGEDIGEDTEEYKYWDRSQGNEKRIVNSYYGGSGTPVSPFYSTWSGPRYVGL